MDLKLTDEQAQLCDIFRALLAKECNPSRVRETEQLGFDAGLWATFSEVGAIGVGVAEDMGGGGAGLLEQALVAEACGRALAPVPFVEAPVAARVLAHHAGGADPLRGALSDGRVLTFAPRPAVGGRAGLVPFGAVAELVVARDGDDLVVAEVEPQGRPPANLGSAAIGDVMLRAGRKDGSCVVLASGVDASRSFAVAQGEWRVLMAAALSGLASGALAIGVEYVKERHQFGRPIGSFQAVAHRLADVAAEVDGAGLLWREAAWAVDEGEPNAVELGHMAFLFAAEVAERSAAVSLHFHGGYGFMLEYDIQLYFRRAKAWPLGMGPRVAGYQRLADELLGPRGA